jgi:hypothetical protein
MIHATISGLMGSGGSSRLAGARLALGKRLRSGAYVLPIGITIVALTLATEAISVYLERQNSPDFWRGAAELEPFQSDDISIRAPALMAVVQETVAGVRAAGRLAGADQ